MVRLFGTLCFIILFGQGSFSQTSCILHLENFEEEIQLDSCWLYHDGDSLLWADADYNDQHWQALDTELDLSRIEPGLFSGKGWFRLRFSTDSTFTDRILGINLDQRGASEIFLDGEKILSQGRIGSDTIGEKALNPGGVPLLFKIEEEGEHVLAVRYSNAAAHSEYRIYNQAMAGFRMSIVEPQAAMFAMLYGSYTMNVIIFLMTVFLVLGMLHILLFLFYKQNKSNLYYSLFVLIFSGVIFVVYTSNAIVLNPYIESRAGYFISLVVPFTMVPLVALLHNIVYARVRIIFWLNLALALLTSLNYLFSSPYINIFYLIYFSFSFIEIIRCIIVAIRKKKEGARILGAGILLFVLFFITMILLVSIKGSFQITGDSPIVLSFIFLIIASILSIPVSMSVFLARDFSITNKKLSAQLEEVKRLSALTLEQEKEKQRILQGQKERLEILVKERTAELQKEKDHTEELLHNILPDKVVRELKNKGYTEPEYFKNVTVYFSDIVGFTALSGELEPDKLISELNEIFTAFDDIMVKNGCERIKTIGDAYLAVCGMPEEDPQHAENILRSSIGILDYLNKRNKDSQIKWHIRIGIHSGEVIGSVVGVRKYIYDVFGDTINTAARMEQSSEAMKINVSPVTYELTKQRFQFQRREALELKGKGTMNTYFLEGLNE